MILPEKIRKKINQLERGMVQDRQSYDPKWEELRDYLCPRRGRNLGGSSNSNENYEGGEKGKKIYDTTQLRALNISAAGMQAGINSPARPWFRLKVGDTELSSNHNVAEWLAKVEEVMRGVYNSAGLYRVFHHNYYELLSFGTSCTGISPSDQSVVQAHPYTIGEYYLTSRFGGPVNGVMRVFHLEVYQVVQKFGIDNVSKDVRKAYEEANYSRKVKVYHLVLPDEFNLKIPRLSGKPWLSIYYEEGFPDGGKVLHFGGFSTQPFAAPRWSVISEEVYGGGPGEDTLPAIRGLQKEKYEQLIALSKVNDPPLVSPPGVDPDIIHRVPGGITPDPTADGSLGLRPLYQIRPDMNALLQEIADTRRMVESGMFTDLFTMIANTVDARKTATEVAALKEEKMMVLGPVLDNIHNELHTPFIQAVFHYTAQYGLLPPPPPEAQGLDLSVEYVSILAQAQKMVATSAIEQVAAFVGNLSAVFPEARHKIDVNEMVDAYAESTIVDPRVIRSDEEYQKIVAAEQQQQQMMQQAAMGQQAAQSAKVLSEADTGGNNALTALMGGQGG